MYRVVKRGIRKYEEHSKFWWNRYLSTFFQFEVTTIILLRIIIRGALGYSFCY